MCSWAVLFSQSPRIVQCYLNDSQRLRHPQQQPEKKFSRCPLFNFDVIFSGRFVSAISQEITHFSQAIVKVVAGLNKNAAARQL